ncbi:murein biosynthesis integral membrane protein MurJ [Parvularcula lutaonensis]|uniref:Probable lipid II flippase MurJ n=1 Tax=Parvularcula lutaonensis TaxID=491923 RepID=A0ABV7MA62_9PROT|nr:murein biosynthesis integral membrane protein MurJ [Parvularcula lutaonensis]GGY36806.1 putative lipid II flippase MurJ [Parvularcula lutaonensis]
MPKLLKSLATVSGLTLLSRLLGFVRQLMMAGIIGASGTPVADAFMAAFRLPNMFRRLLAEGAFQAAFVPLFQGKEAEGGIEEARRFAEDILAWLVVVLTVLSGLVMVFTPVAISILTSGFRDDPERFNLAVLYARIMFPYLACMSVVGIYGGMLNAIGRFAVAAAAPLLLNICMISAMLVTAQMDVEVTGLTLSFAVLAAGISQLFWLVWGASRSKLLLRLRIPRITASAKRMVALGTPGFIAASALQVNAIVGTNIASQQIGAVAWLAYADQLYQLPLGIIGIALGVVLMPAIGRAVKSGDETKAARTLQQGVLTALFFAVPAAAGLIMLGSFIAEALFQDLAGAATKSIGAGGSAFNDTDVQMVGAALFIFGWGVPAFVLQKVFAAAYFAREDTKTPMRFALTAIAINAVISIGLFPFIAFLSVPTGTVIAGWTEVMLLSTTLHRRGILNWKPLIPRLLAMTVATAGLVTGLWYALGNREALEAVFLGQSWLLLFALAGAGAVGYGLVSLLLGAVKVSDLKPKAG